MAAALARRHLMDHDADVDIDVRSGGTHPASSVHPVVVTAMAEIGIDLSDAQPRAIPPSALERYDVVVTMGCSTLDLDVDTDVRTWEFPDPEGRGLDEVRDIRDDLERRVTELLDEFLSGDR